MRPWDPWEELLGHEPGDAMRDPSPRVRRPGAVSGVGVPVDILETEDAYVIYAVIPGVRPEEIQLQVVDNTLQLSGEVREPSVSGNWLSRERRFGHFRRRLPLPGQVRVEDAEAEYSNGVLVVRLPKAAESGARSIPIRRAGRL